MPNFADQNKPYPPPSPDEYGLYVRPIFSGSDPNILTVSLASGAFSIGNISGSFSTPHPGTADLQVVSDSSSPVVIASGNIGRMALTIYNDSSGTLFLRMGSVSASLSAFTVKLASQDFYELQTPCYTGPVTGIWNVPSGGGAMVTELTL